MARQSVFEMDTAVVYQSLVNKVVRKGRTKEEVDYLIQWLTGYDISQMDLNIPYGKFFENAPCFNEKSKNITGKICGVQIDQIEDVTMQKIRFLDKLVDELSKGKSIELILKKLD